MDQDKETLIIEWKKLRGEFFNLFEEDQTKFEKSYKDHPLFDHVVIHFDKSFKEVNQIAEFEIEKYLSKTIF